MPGTPGYQLQLPGVFICIAIFYLTPRSRYNIYLMSDKEKTALIEAVEFVASKLNVKKGETYNKIKEVIEEQVKDSDDWLEAAKPQVRIHKAPIECLACEA